jgi:excisionase family DNA binding protein
MATIKRMLDSSIDQKVLLRPARFADLADLSRSHVYALIKSGELRAVRVGTSWRIPRAELDRLVRGETLATVA